jgi:hypothetical protein
MAIKGSFYANSAANDRPYYYYNHNEIHKDVFTNGIATRGAALGTKMQVTKVTGTMKSQVNLGVAYVEGIRSEIYTAQEEVTHSAADPSNPRYDAVCLEVNTTAGVRNSRIVKVEGTPAASPSYPALTTTATQYQMALAYVLIPAASTASDQFTYTDVRVIAYTPLYMSAASVAIADAGGRIAATDVEGALQEIAADGWVTAARIAVGTITSAKYGAGSVDNTAIGAGAVTATKIGAGAVVRAAIGNGAIHAEHFSADAVESAAIKDGAVTSGKIGTGAVLEAAIGAAQVTTDKLGVITHIHLGADDVLTFDDTNNYLTLAVDGGAARIIPTIIISTSDPSGVYPDGTLWAKVAA